MTEYAFNPLTGAVMEEGPRLLEVFGLPEFPALDYGTYHLGGGEHAIGYGQYRRMWWWCEWVKSARTELLKALSSPAVGTAIVTAALGDRDPVDEQARIDMALRLVIRRLAKGSSRLYTSRNASDWLDGPAGDPRSFPAVGLDLLMGVLVTVHMPGCLSDLERAEAVLEALMRTARDEDVALVLQERGTGAEAVLEAVEVLRALKS